MLLILQQLLVQSSKLLIFGGCDPPLRFGVDSGAKSPIVCLKMSRALKTSSKGFLHSQ